MGKGWRPQQAAALLLMLGLAVLGALPLNGGPVPLASVARAAPALAAPLPAGWPSSLQLGLMDGPGGAAALRATAPFGFRYQYLAGGANTGSGWATWNPNGSFVTLYIQDSAANQITPVFSYYMLLQSNGPCGSCGEKEKDLAHLADTPTMTALFNDLKLFYQRAGAFPSTRVVLHVEPDLWGYVQQAAIGDDAATVPAAVAATGLPELAGLPNSVAGFAAAVRRLRDAYAPNVQLGYHLSIWGTGVDVQLSKPAPAQVDALATRSAAFYRSLGVDFDVSFAEFSDRDAAFYQYIYGDGGAHWMTADDFARHVRYLSTYSSASGKRVVLWQIPLGNTRMRALNNTWNHYQDNRVEWLLDDPSRAHLTSYLDAGVVAFLFGRGADGATCACDAAGDGVTNPAPITGNTTSSLNADDDGGYFRQKAGQYYTTGPMPLPGSGTPPATPSPTVPAPSTATPTAVPPAATNTPVPTAPPAPCAPRPSVSVATAPSAPGRLQVSVRATVSAGTPSNALAQLRFTGLTNASVDAGSQTGATAPFSLTLSPGAMQSTFFVNRLAAGQASTVTLVAVDVCGDWPTVVGGGPTAF